MIETENSLLELEERIEELEISLNQILNYDVDETISSQLKIYRCKMELREILLPHFSGKVWKMV